METKIITGAFLNPHTLCIEICKISNYYEVIPNRPLKKSQELIASNTEFMEKFPLSPIGISDLENIRESGKSVLIYKNGNSFYYVEIPEDLSISTRFFENHKCSRLNEDCDHLYALPEEKGGCQRVFEKNPKIEDYPWITKGFQTINCIDNRFYIAKCEHFEHTGKRKRLIPYKELMKIRQDLSELYFD